MFMRAFSASLNAIAWLKVAMKWKRIHFDKSLRGYIDIGEFEPSTWLTWNCDSESLTY